MHGHQYWDQPEDPTQRAIWLRMIEREAWEIQDQREAQRAIEDSVLATADAMILAGRAVRSTVTALVHEVAASIRDHREAGHYTTMHR